MGLLDQAFRVDAGEDAVGAFLSSYVAFLQDNRALLRLDALWPMLAHKLETETLLVFKRTFLERLTTGGTLIDRALGLPQGSGLKILMRTHALTCGLWQSLGSGRASDPAAECATFHADFFTELPEALAEYWRGARGTAMG